MKIIILLLWAALAMPLLAQNQGGGITQPSSGTQFAVSSPTAAPYSPGVVGTSPTLSYEGVLYTCAGANGAPCAYAANPAAFPTQAAQTFTANPTSGTAAPTGITAAAAAAILPLSTQVRGFLNANNIRDMPSILDQSSVVSDVVINSSVSTTSGSAVVTMSGLSSADIGKSIVIFTPNFTDEFQSTISAVSGSTVTLSSNADVTASARIAYYGTDSTTGIDAAATVAIATNRCLLIPSGNYFYNGTGLALGQSPCIQGHGQFNSVVYLGVGKYLVDDNQFWQSSNFQDFGMYGGDGGIRNRYNSQMVSAPKVFHNLRFAEYAHSAINFNSTDLTYFSSKDSAFYGLNTINSMGIAIAGPDHGVIQSSEFLNDRFHVKLGGGGVGMVMTANDFIEFNPENTPGSLTRSSIWVVPNNGSISGYGSTGLMVHHNKFGSENLDAKDVRMLLADTATGDFGTTLPLVTASTGPVSFFSFTDNEIISGGPVVPVVYSYTPNLQANTIWGNQIYSTLPSYAFQFDAVVPVANDRSAMTSIVGNWQTFGGGNLGFGTGSTPISSNIAGYVVTNDPTGLFSFTDPLVMSPFGNGASAGYLNLLSAATTSFTVLGGGSKTNITDSDGGTDAIEVVNGTPNANNIFATLLSVPTGVQLWLQFDAKQGSGTSATTVAGEISDGNGTGLTFAAPVTLTPGWHRYTVPFVLRATPSATPMQVNFFPTTTTATGTTEDIGRVRVYVNPQAVGGGYFNTAVIAPQLNGHYSVVGSRASCVISGTSYTTAGDCAFYSAKAAAIAANSASDLDVVGSASTCAGWTEPSLIAATNAHVNIHGIGPAGAFLEQACTISTPTLYHPDIVSAGGFTQGAVIENLTVHANGLATKAIGFYAYNRPTIHNLFGNGGSDGTADFDLGDANVDGSNNKLGQIIWLQATNFGSAPPSGANPGRGAALTVTLTGSSVTSITSTGGTNYSSRTIVIFSGFGNGSTPCSVMPTATVTLTGGVPSSFTITNGGTCTGTVYASLFDQSTVVQYGLRFGNVTDSPAITNPVSYEGSVAGIDFEPLSGNNKIIGAYAVGVPVGYLDASKNLWYSPYCDTLVQYCFEKVGTGLSKIFGPQHFWSTQFNFPGSSDYLVSSTTDLEIYGDWCTINSPFSGYHHIVVSGSGPVDTGATLPSLVRFFGSQPCNGTTNGVQPSNFMGRTFSLSSDNVSNYNFDINPSTNTLRLQSFTALSQAFQNYTLSLSNLIPATSSVPTQNSPTLGLAGALLIGSTSSSDGFNFTNTVSASGGMLTIAHTGTGNGAIAVPGNIFVASGTSGIWFGSTGSSFNTGVSGVSGGVLKIIGTGGINFQNGGTVVASMSSTGGFTMPSLSFSGTAPSCTVGASAGTGATCSVTGTNQAAVVTLNTGTIPSGSGTAVTITYSGTVTTAPVGCTMMPRNAATAGQISSVFTTAPSTTSYTIGVDTIALPASTSGLVWYVPCT